MARAIGVQASTPASFGGARERLREVRFVATDADIAVGTGPETHAPALSILLYLSGRDML